MNARFWIWWNGGWAKLTLKPGQTMELYHRGPTDEGWSSHGDRYTHDGDGVLNEWHTDGVDCDGRLEQYGECYCPLEQLSAREMDTVDPCSENKWVFAPQWEKVNSGQRDYAAEAMGY